jgi:VanZ family protein
MRPWRSPSALWLPPFFLMVAIFIVSSSSTPAAIKKWIPHQDKLAHAAVFGALSYLLGRAALLGWKCPFGRAALFAIGLSAAYAIFDEWHQSFVPGRVVDWRDWLADLIGAILAQIAVRRHWKPPPNSERGRPGT